MWEGHVLGYIIIINMVFVVTGAGPLDILAAVNKILYAGQRNVSMRMHLH